MTKLDITTEVLQKMSSTLGVASVEIEFPAEHDLEMFKDETECYLIDSITCYHIPSKRSFILAYSDCVVFPCLNPAGNVQISVGLKGELDAGFMQQNEEENGVLESEITTQFMMESIVVSFAAAREKTDGEVDAICTLRELMIWEFPVDIEESARFENGYLEDEESIKQLKAEWWPKSSDENFGRYLGIEVFTEGLTLIYDNGKEGFIDKNGEMAVKPRYDWVDKLSDGLARVRVGDSWGFIDDHGAIAIEPRYQEVLTFAEGLAIVNDNGKWGAINRQGETVIEFQYDFIEEFQEGLARILISDEMDMIGYIDTQGKIIVEPQYPIAYPFHEGHAIVLKIDQDEESDPVWQLIDTTGTAVKDLPGDYYQPYNEGLAVFRIGEDENVKYGYINTLGEVVIEPLYCNAYSFSNGMAKVFLQKDGEWLNGVINRQGEYIVEPQYKHMYNFQEGLMAVLQDDVWGFVDTRGKVVVKPGFQLVSDFMNGMAAVQVGGQWGFINTSGEMVIQPQFINVGGTSGYFSQGLAAVKSGVQWGYINETGIMVVPPQFDSCRAFADGMAAVKIDGKWGFIDQTGRMVIEPQFDEIFMDFKQGTAWVKRLDGVPAYIDTTGEVIAVSNKERKRRKLILQRIPWDSCIILTV